MTEQTVPGKISEEAARQAEIQKSIPSSGQYPSEAEVRAAAAKQAEETASIRQQMTIADGRA